MRSKRYHPSALQLANSLKSLNNSRIKDVSPLGSGSVRGFEFPAYQLMPARYYGFHDDFDYVPGDFGRGMQEQVSTFLYDRSWSNAAGLNTSQNKKQCFHDGSTNSARGNYHRRSCRSA